VTNDNEQTDGYVDASVALFRAHNYVKLKTNSAAKALSFLTDIYAKATKASDITADMVVKEFKRRYPKETHLDDVFGPDSDYDEGRKVSLTRIVPIVECYNYNFVPYFSLVWSITIRLVSRRCHK
jgi:hypothetical protein